MTILTTTDLVARATARSGFAVSAAAMGDTSAPTTAAMTTETAPKTVPTPLGKKPPWAVRLLKSRPCCGQKPRTNIEPSTRNATIAATLIPANQNSNSQNAATENRLVAVIETIRMPESSHSGALIQYDSTEPPAIASN